MARASRTLPVLLAVSIASVVLTGGLGDPPPGGFVRFDDIRREEFSALAVQRSYGEPDARPLVVRVDVIGDASDADWTRAAQWLSTRANVRLVDDARGAPLYLTRENLIATSGPSALGATVRSGMVVEMRDPDVSPCVLAHEVLHFLGLHHVDDPKNLMYSRCASGKLATATLDADQRDELARLSTITAVTPAGLVTWAAR